MSRHAIFSLAAVLLSACDPSTDERTLIDAAVESEEDLGEPSIVYAGERWSSAELGEMPLYAVSTRAGELHAFDDWEDALAFMAEHRPLDRVADATTPAATSGYACFYNEPYFNPDWGVYCWGGGIYWPQANNGWNDRISSLTNFLSDLKLEFYEHGNFQGDMDLLWPNSELANLHGYPMGLPWQGDWGDKISSMKTRSIYE